MRVLVFGASGATGCELVKHLVEQNVTVRAFARDGAAFPEGLVRSGLLEVVRGNVSELDVAALAKLMGGCDAVASCLGHRITLKGLFGPPWNLVSGLVDNLTRLAQVSAAQPLKFVLMSTSGYTNRRLNEGWSLAEHALNAALKLLLPPHRDNYRAADHLLALSSVRGGPFEWVVVRPDTLTDGPGNVDYAPHSHTMRSPIFDPGAVSRTNVGRFMADLLCDDVLWKQWVFGLPVLYDQAL